MAAARAVPPLGGFNRTLLGIELRRMFRNKRTLFFTIIMPTVFFEIFGAGNAQAHARVGNGNVIAYVLVSMAVYGAMLASTSAGASVSIERAAGWSRQLRLTPLRPISYIATKLAVALCVSAVGVLVLNLIGTTSDAQMPTGIWILSAFLALVTSLVFAAFGLFMGYLLPSENVMQILGPGLALLSFAGGLFIPLTQYSHTFQALAKLTPVYGVGEVARYPLTRDGDFGVGIVNVVLWTAVFGVGAAWRFRQDTLRV